MTKSLLSLLVVLSAAVACGEDDGPSPDASPQNLVDAMPGPDSDAMASGIGYMEACDVDDDQCAEGLLCFGFNMNGPHCTHACENDDECEEPTKGCGGMNVCSPL